MGEESWNELVQKQRKERWPESILLIHAEQEMDFGGGAEQTYVEVPSGNSEFYIYLSKLHFDFPGWIGGY